MRILTLFSRIQYDVKKSRVIVTFLHIVVTCIVLVLQWANGLELTEALLFTGSAVAFCIGHWFSSSLYRSMKSLYFFLQGLVVLVAVLALPDYAIIVLITFGAILVVQAFYFLQRMRQFLLFLLFYIIYGSVIVYFSYGEETLSFYIILLCLALILVFMVVSIFTQKELENLELVAANEQIALLTRQNERQRMARDLHDSLIQRLIALNLKMDVIDAHVKKGRTEKAEAIIATAKQQVQESIDEARQVVSDLRLQLDDLSFRERVLEEVQQWQFVYQFNVDIEWALETEPPAALAMNMLAIMKEAVTNTYKHAEAQHVKMAVVEQATCYKLHIADDGIGIDVQSAFARSQHYGLVGMQERVQLFRGQLHVRKEDGTVIDIVFPKEVEP